MLRALGPLNGSLAHHVLPSITRQQWLRTWATEYYQRLYQQYQRAYFTHVDAQPKSLNLAERSMFSQNGEDGIIQEIFTRIGYTDRFFVEFGIEDGRENNTRRLLEQMAFSGVWIEADETMAESATSANVDRSVTVLCDFVTSSNICSLLASAKAPTQFDLLSVDIDGNDYWVLRRILEKYQPRVVVAEYNAFFAPGHRWVMPENDAHHWVGTNHYGMSLDSLTWLLKRAQYTLVGCDLRGVNAFFVQNSLLEERFPDAGNVARLYRAPRFGAPWFGHPPVVVQSPAPKALSASEMNVHGDWAVQPRTQYMPGAVFLSAITIQNDSVDILGSADTYSTPQLAVHWQNADGEIAYEHGYPSFLAPSLKAHSKEWYTVAAFAPWEPGDYTLVVNLVIPPEHRRIALACADVRIHEVHVAAAD